VNRELAVAVAGAPRCVIEGRFERHISAGYRTLNGSDGGGRWGPPGAYSVLYLGRPRSSVTVEAYRHLVDPFAADGMTGAMVAPRRLIVCDVTVTEVLDLRTPEGRAAVGLDSQSLESDIDDYTPCQTVGQVAHQLGLHGIIAPAATRLGETLALFEQHLPAEELPLLVNNTEIWEGLPADPRRLRLIADDAG
jgi:RES domain-containing protein